jgi:hypothetical protein
VSATSTAEPHTNPDDALVCAALDEASPDAVAIALRDLMDAHDLAVTHDALGAMSYLALFVSVHPGKPNLLPIVDALAGLTAS